MSVLRGIMRIARFRADALAEFDASRNGVLNSLAPLIAFPLVGALLETQNGDLLGALTDFLGSVVALLAPLVISQALAQLWRSEARWLGYATASNWAQWILPFAVAALMSAFWLLGHTGVQITQPVEIAGLVALLLYGLAIHWFLCRTALGLSRLRAAVMVLGCDVITVVLVMGPRLLAMHLSGQL